MNKAQAKAEAKKHLTEYVEKFCKRDKKAGARMYACPFCNSGHGGRGSTGAFSITEDGERWTCFSCHKSGDIFDLYRLRENVDGAELFNRVYEMCGITVDSNDQEVPQEDLTQSVPATTGPDSLEEEPEENLIDYFKRCAENRPQIQEYIESRGISETVANHYMLGCDPVYCEGTGGKIWKALIIPTSTGTFTARNTDRTAAGNDRIRKHGRSKIFNEMALYRSCRPVFIVEGEIDALSIIEAGGEAVGLGSTMNTGKLIRMLKEDKPVQPLIIALDNDDAGQRAEAELIKAFTADGIKFYKRQLYGSAKDANEALTTDRQAFITAVREASQAAALEEDADKREYLNNRATAHLDELHKEVEESATRPLPKTGFQLLDNELDGGLHPGLYMLGAVSSLGKSTIMMQMADQIAQQGFDVLIFSLEMARLELVTKSISRETFLFVKENNGDRRNAKTARGIIDGRRYAKYSVVEKTIIHNAEEKYKTYGKNVYIIEGAGNVGTEQIRQTVEKHKTFTGRTPVIFVDYFQILEPWSTKITDKQAADHNIVELKRISRDYMTPVFSASSFGRTKYDTEASMSSYKESGGIEYSADVLLGMQAKGVGEPGFNSDREKAKDPRTLQIKIMKNRNGRTGGVIDYKYYPMFNYFEEE